MYEQRPRVESGEAFGSRSDRLGRALPRPGFALALRAPARPSPHRSTGRTAPDHSVRSVVCGRNKRITVQRYGWNAQLNTAQCSPRIRPSIPCDHGAQLCWTLTEDTWCAAVQKWSAQIPSGRELPWSGCGRPTSSCSSRLSREAFEVLRDESAFDAAKRCSCARPGGRPPQGKHGSRRRI